MEISHTKKPSVLFVCVHNAGRSQMAEGWVRHLAQDRVDVYSGGSNPGKQFFSSTKADISPRVKNLVTAWLTKIRQVTIDCRQGFTQLLRSESSAGQPTSFLQQ
ncbi:MAG: hypothetical protein ACKOAE_07265 [Acidimicrobiaceae bacterium]